MTKKNIAWEWINKLVDQLASEINWEKYNGIYALPRGGLIAGVMLSHRTGLPLLNKVRKGCLVVDDIADTGKALMATTEDIAVLFKRHSCPTEVIAFGHLEDSDDWLVFPWEVRED